MGHGFLLDNKNACREAMVCLVPALFALLWLCVLDVSDKTDCPSLVMSSAVVVFVFLPLE
jgi:hypothetical protein